MEEKQIVKIHNPFYIDITLFKSKMGAFQLIQRLAFDYDWFWNSTGEQNEIHPKCIQCFNEIKYMLFGINGNNTITWAREDVFFNASSLETKGLTEILHCEKEEDTLLNLMEQLKQGVQYG